MSSADELKKKATAAFFRKGLTLAVLSGIAYGLSSAFLTLAESEGVWGEWFGASSPLSAFAVTFVLASLASGINDLPSKPGRVMMACALVGGPIGATLYVIALNMATAAGAPGIIVPVAALNVAAGAVLSHILFKQELNARMVFGIVVCLVCCGVIGGTSFSNVGTDVLVACLFALGAAICWGIEGCIAGFGTALIDYNVGITIRQITSGLVTLFVLVPALCVAGGDGLALYPRILGAAFTDQTLLWFVVSGFFSMYAYSLWYKGNSMCGTALGMACNGMYSFWAPLFIWVVNGLLNLGGQAAAYPSLSWIQWIAAVIMALGIFIIATDPVEYLSRKGQKED